MGPLPQAQVRTRSGRSETARCTRIAPQSWPTRSTGAPARSTSRTSQSMYASLVASKPAGRAHPKPGSDGATTSARRRRARSGAHRRCVSGTPWTRTAGTKASLARRRTRTPPARPLPESARTSEPVSMPHAAVPRACALRLCTCRLRAQCEAGHGRRTDRTCSSAGRHACVLELAWGKQRIREVYGNTVEWGDGVYGVEAAARRYFGVPAARLDAWQSALLAAVLPNPRRWSPAAPTPYLRARAAIIAARAERVRLS